MTAAAYLCVSPWRFSCSRVRAKNITNEIAKGKGHDGIAQVVEGGAYRMPPEPHETENKSRRAVRRVRHGRGWSYPVRPSAEAISIAAIRAPPPIIVTFPKVDAFMDR